MDDSFVLRVLLFLDQEGFSPFSFHPYPAIKLIIDFFDKRKILIDFISKCLILLKLKIHMGKVNLYHSIN